MRTADWPAVNSRPEALLDRMARVKSGELSPKSKVHKWHCFDINCDCASGPWQQRRPPVSSLTPLRCPFCNRGLGDMEFRYLGAAYAVLSGDAVKIIAQHKKAQLETDSTKETTNI